MRPAGPSPLSGPRMCLASPQKWKPTARSKSPGAHADSCTRVRRHAPHPTYVDTHTPACPATRTLSCGSLLDRGWHRWFLGPSLTTLAGAAARSSGGLPPTHTHGSRVHGTHGTRYTASAQEML